MSCIRTLTNRVGKRFWNVRAMSLALALVSGVSIHARAAKSAIGLSSLPPDAQGPISAALGKNDSRYWVHRNAGGFRGQNPRQALVVEFTREGAEVRNGNLRWELETRSYGYGDALHPLKTVAPSATANRIEYRRDGLTEWYENGPLGLEQGFTLAHRPREANGQALTLELRLRGDLIPALEPGGNGLELKPKDGKAALRYTGLEARDAIGRELRSWLEVRGERLLLRVEDSGARYPVVVDPWIQEAELTASDGATGDIFGNAVAISGSTAVVGASNHTVGSNQYQGAAYVFVVSGGKWSQQAELTASDGAEYDGFGLSVAVSGSTVVVGAPCHMVDSNTCQGAAYVFVEGDGKWTQQAELTASDGAEYDLFGRSVAVSGSTALVGATNHPYPGPGAAYVFVRRGGTWSQQAELTASDGHGIDSFGYSVAITGSTAVVGADSHIVGSNFFQGAAYVFAENGGTWGQQAELTASDGQAYDYFGYSVAVSGSTAVVGAPQHTVASNVGAAYVFVETGGTWSQQAELTASYGAGVSLFGDSVGVSVGTLVVGAYIQSVGSNSFQGAAYVFGGSGGAWSQQAELTASDGKAGDYFGSSVAVSGGTAIVGAPDHTVGSNSDQGAAYVVSVTTAVFQSQVSVSASGLAYSRITQTFNGTVTLTNKGTSTISGPLQLVLFDLPTNVSLMNASGTFSGAPYITIPAANGLASSESITVPVEFKNPLHATIDFTPAVHSGSIN